MKKYISIFCLLLCCMFSFALVGCGDTNTPPSNEGGGTTEIKYNIEVVGGTGSGMYSKDEMVTITSNDKAFLWWQEEGGNTKLSTSKTYSFLASKDVKIISVDLKERDLGYAIMELPTNGFDITREYFFSFGKNSQDKFEAKINGTIVSSHYKDYEANAWITTGTNWKMINSSGTSIFKIVNKNNYYYVFEIYRDIDDTAKAFTGIPNTFSNGVEMTVYLGTGRSINFVFE